MIVRTAQRPASRPEGPESPGTDSHAMLWGWPAPHSSARRAKPNASNPSSSAITVYDVGGSGDAGILETWLPRTGACTPRTEKQFPDLGIYSFAQPVHSEKKKTF